MTIEMSAPVSSIAASRRVLHDMVHDHISQAAFVVAAAIVGIGYSLLLPFDITQRLTWHNWQYLNLRFVLLSIAFGVVMGWVVMVQVCAMRRILTRSGSTLGSASAAGHGLLPSFLCCTPIVPTVVSFIGRRQPQPHQRTSSVLLRDQTEPHPQRQFARRGWRRRLVDQQDHPRSLPHRRPRTRHQRRTLQV
jgi:hypothetical protein